MKPTVVVMLKEPRPGRVKTRLGREIGMVPAAWWFRHQTRGLLRRLGADPRWHLCLAVSPDAAGLTSRVWPPGLQRIPQGTGSLGDRMARILRAPIPGPLLIIGADVPGITPRTLSAALLALRGHDAVLGPAPDGGYWCIGRASAAALPPTLLEGVRWSTAFALEDTRRSLGALRIAQAPTLADVDTAQDLRRP